jgi:hypothetical protein
MLDALPTIDYPQSCTEQTRPLPSCGHAKKRNDLGPSTGDGDGKI